MSALRFSVGPDWLLGDDVVEESLALGGLLGDRELVVLRPRDPETLLCEQAFEREDLLPYWAELWPSGIALARSVAARALRGARTLELGCGLGVAAITAARVGGRVLATDWSRPAVAFTARNAERNHVQLETAVCSWQQPRPLLVGSPWDLVLAADVLYERAQVQLLLDLLPRLVAPRGEVWLADPGRPPSQAFLAAVNERWERRSTPALGFGAVALHRLRLRDRRAGSR